MTMSRSIIGRFQAGFGRRGPPAGRWLKRVHRSVEVARIDRCVVRPPSDSGRKLGTQRRDPRVGAGARQWPPRCPTHGSAGQPREGPVGCAIAPECRRRNHPCSQAPAAAPRSSGSSCRADHRMWLCRQVFRRLSAEFAGRRRGRRRPSAGLRRRRSSQCMGWEPANGRR